MFRRWAERKGYVPPVPFLEMQKKGRERGDGTVIVGALLFDSFIERLPRESLSLPSCPVLLLGFSGRPCAILRLRSAARLASFLRVVPRFGFEV